MTTVPSGQSYTAWGYLRPTTDHKPARLTMVVSWKSLTGSVVSPNSSVLVDLGKDSVQGYGDIAWDLLSGFAKVFAIPLTLAIIGFSLNERAKKHQEQTEKERR